MHFLPLWKLCERNYILCLTPRYLLCKLNAKAKELASKQNCMKTEFANSIKEFDWPEDNTSSLNLSVRTNHQ